jgi:hypothetical protein
MRVDPDALRVYARTCDRSGDWVRQPVHMSVDHPSFIRPDAWDGGWITVLLQLQGALNDMRETYDRVRISILGGLQETSSDLHGTGDRLRESADNYETVDEESREELEHLWP